MRHKLSADFMISSLSSVGLLPLLGSSHVDSSGFI